MKTVWVITTDYNEIIEAVCSTESAADIYIQNNEVVATQDNPWSGTYLHKEEVMFYD